jgi:hypothetical protein
MNTTLHFTTRRFVAALGIAAAAAAMPALLVGGAGTAHADDPCYGALSGSYYCSPGVASQPAPSLPTYAPVQPPFGYNNLPGCSSGSAIVGALSGEGC